MFDEDDDDEGPPIRLRQEIMPFFIASTGSIEIGRKVQSGDVSLPFLPSTTHGIVDEVAIAYLQPSVLDHMEDLFNQAPSFDRRFASFVEAHSLRVVEFERNEVVLSASETGKEATVERKLPFESAGTTFYDAQDQKPYLAMVSSRVGGE